MAAADSPKRAGREPVGRIADHPGLRPALVDLRDRFAAIARDKAAIAAAMKEALAAHQLKMPQLAPALRVLVCGRAQTPSIDAVLALFTRDVVLARLQHV